MVAIETDTQPHGVSCDCGRTFSTVEALRTHLQKQTPEILYGIVDPSVPEGKAPAESAKVLNGIFYVVLDYEPEHRCADCNKEGAYFLRDDPYGDGFCRHHLERGPSLAAVVDSRDVVKEFEFPEGPVRRGEQDGNR